MTRRFPTSVALVALLPALAVATGFGAPALAQDSGPGLSAADAHFMDGMLRKLSRGRPWTGPEFNAMVRIFGNPSYVDDDWRAYFGAYFGKHPLTEELEFDLGTLSMMPAVAAARRANVQKGIARTFLAMTEDAIDDGPDRLLLLLRRSQSRETLVGIQRYLMRLAGGGERGAILESGRRLGALVRDSSVLAAGHHDPETLARVATYRSIVWQALWLSRLGKPGVVANTLGLRGTRRRILRRRGVLLIDNDGLSAAQLGVIDRYLSLIPRRLPLPSTITVNDLIGNVGDLSIWMPIPGGDLAPGVNIIGTWDVGRVSENSFPPDVERRLVDVFSVVLAHEANHTVNAVYVESDPVLRARQRALIRRAGRRPENYLRSMVLRDGGDDFFKRNPQEFFASMANQWFTDSAHTLSLALHRFARGFTEPVNQFLFLADVYSVGGDTTRFYTCGTDGEFRMQEVRIRRNRRGLIRRLHLGGSIYSFGYDADGFVRDVRVRP